MCSETALKPASSYALPRRDTNSVEQDQRRRFAKVTRKRKNRKCALHRTTDYAKLQESSNLTLPQTSQFPSPVGRRADLELRRFHAERRAELAGVARLALGGAIADRFDRRRVLMITQTAAMIQAFIYWLAVQFEVIQLWHIAVLAFFLGIVNTINQTSRQSLVNSLVPKEELLNAIGLQSSVFNFSKILGPSAGGLIIASVGIAGCFLVNAISFVFLLFNLYLMELPPWEKRKDQQNIWADVKEGFHYLLSNRRMLYIVGLSYVIATFGAPYNRFVPIFATNVLHVGGLWPADVGARRRRHGGGIGVGVGEQAPGRDPIHMRQLIGVCGVDRLVRLFAQLLFVISLSGDDRILPDRRARALQHRHSDLYAGPSARTRTESLFYGPWLVVPRQYDHRRVRRGDRHGLDLRHLRRGLRDHRDRAADRQPSLPS